MRISKVPRAERIETYFKYRWLGAVVSVLGFALNIHFQLEKLRVLGDVLAIDLAEAGLAPRSWEWFRYVLQGPVVQLVLVLAIIYGVPLVVWWYQRMKESASPPRK